MSLNPRQKRTVEIFHLTGNGTAAYMEVYGTEDPRVAEAAASRLLSSVKAQEYLEFLQSGARVEFSVTREDMLRGFHEIFAAKGIEETRDRINAGKEICRIMGFYETKKVELSADDSLSAILQRVTGAKDL